MSFEAFVFAIAIGIPAGFALLAIGAALWMVRARVRTARALYAMLRRPDVTHADVSWPCSCARCTAAREAYDA